MKKIILITFFFILLAAAFANRSEFITFAQNIEMWSLSNPISTASMLIALKIISAPLGFPGTPLTLLSGSLFGNFVGTIIAIIGNTLGATLAFSVSRYLLRDYVQNKFISNNKLIKKYETRLETKPMATVMLLRIIPIFPFNALNFLLGISNIPIKKYIIGSFIGMIPGTFMFVYFGESIRMLNWINIVFAIVGIILLTYIGKFYEKQS